MESGDSNSVGIWSLGSGENSDDDDDDLSIDDDANKEGVYTLYSMEDNHHLQFLEVNLQDDVLFLKLFRCTFIGEKFNELVFEEANDLIPTVDIKFVHLCLTEIGVPKSWKG